jgi:GMP synthase (glutamine-hydrolysing)
MARSALALRHIAFEDLGLLRPVLEANGWQVSLREGPLCDFADPALFEADLLVVLGGPIGAYETDIYPFLVLETRLIEQRLKAGKAVLGICLGAQLMAAALGARVYPGGKKEIGWGKVTATQEGAASALAPLAKDEARVLHWHGDTFDLPQDAVRLISNENYPNQAFSYGAKALGLQFHLEAVPSRIESWLVGHALELAKAGIDIPQLRVETKNLAPLVERQAQKIFDTWVKAL